MVDILIKFFETHTSLDGKEEEAIRRIVATRTVPKKTSLLRAGEVSSEFYFIYKGCVRLFYYSGMEEKTAFFYTENMFVSSYESFTKQIPAKHNLQAIEDSSLAVFTAEGAQELLDVSPKFELLARLMMEEELSVYQNIISSFVSLNAEQRYEALLKEKPELLQRIPQHQIATFLGITAETLSRIRKRLTDR